MGVSTILARMSSHRASGRSWWPWLAAWTVVGLGIRLATVYANPSRPPGGDPYAYYWGARLLVAGHGFSNPFDFNQHHQVVQSAAFAPLYFSHGAVVSCPVIGTWSTSESAATHRPRIWRDRRST